jgi:hypothetical protein
VGHPLLDLRDKTAVVIRGTSVAALINSYFPAPARPHGLIFRGKPLHSNSTTSLFRGTALTAGLCGWIGCKNPSEATLDARPLCRRHFYDIASRRLADYHERFAGADPIGRDRVNASAFLSDLIGQAGTLVTSAKLLTDKERDDFLALSTGAVEMYKRVQRNPRIPLRVPIRVYREPGLRGRFELTATVNVSKVGACITVREPVAVGARLWLQKTDSAATASGCVSWTKESSPSQFLAGFEILDHEDFWDLQQQLSSDSSRQNTKAPPGSLHES